MGLFYKAEQLTVQEQGSIANTIKKAGVKKFIKDLIFDWSNIWFNMESNEEAKFYKGLFGVDVNGSGDWGSAEFDAFYKGAFKRYPTPESLIDAINKVASSIDRDYDNLANWEYDEETDEYFNPKTNKKVTLY